MSDWLQWRWLHVHRYKQITVLYKLIVSTKLLKIFIHFRVLTDIKHTRRCSQVVIALSVSSVLSLEVGGNPLR